MVAAACAAVRLLLLLAATPLVPLRGPGEERDLGGTLLVNYMMFSQNITIEQEAFFHIELKIYR